MGTRGLHKVIKDGKTVVAQYSQWDNYIDGTGVEALDFFREIVKDEDSKKRFRDNLDRVHVADGPYDHEEFAKVFGEGGVAEQEKWEPIKWRGTLDAQFPGLSRNTGAQIYYHILNLKESEVLLHCLDTEFEKDILFCEGVSCIDTDSWEFSWTVPGYHSPSCTLKITDKSIPSRDEFLDAWYELVGEE